MRNRTWFIIGWAVALTLAMALDRPTAATIRATHLDSFVRSHALRVPREMIKGIGYFPTTIVIALILAIFHPWRQTAGAFLLVATLPASLNEPTKWLIGRARPFKTLADKAELPNALPFAIHPMSTPFWRMFTTQNVSFPSGHTTLAFATAAAMGILLPRWRSWFYATACVVGLERVLENAHWCSDVVAGALLGIVGVQCVRAFGLIYNRRRPLNHAV